MTRIVPTVHLSASVPTFIAAGERDLYGDTPATVHKVYFHATGREPVAVSAETKATLVEALEDAADAINFSLPEHQRSDLATRAMRTARALYGTGDDVHPEYTRALVDLVADVTPTDYDDDDHRANIQEAVTAHRLVLIPTHDTVTGQWCEWSGSTIRNTECPRCGDVGAR